MTGQPKGQRDKGTDGSRSRRGVRPAAGVEAREGAPEDFKKQLKVARAAGAIDDGEGAEAEGVGEFARVVAGGLLTLDGDGRRRGVEAGEELQQAAAALGEIFLRRGSIEREAEVDDGDVDGVGLDEVLGLAAGAGTEGLDAHGLEEPGELVDPGLGAPAGVGEEEVEAAAGRGAAARMERVDGIAEIIAHRHHRA